MLRVDSSAPALARTGLHVQPTASTPPATPPSMRRHATLRACIEQGASFDAIVLDPPKFAPTVAHAENAARAYKDINRLALKLLAPGGVSNTLGTVLLDQFSYVLHPDRWIWIAGQSRIDDGKALSGLALVEKQMRIVALDVDVQRVEGDGALKMIFGEVVLQQVVESGARRIMADRFVDVMVQGCLGAGMCLFQLLEAPVFQN